MSLFDNAEKFSLRWNNFQSNLSKTFSSLRSEDEFYDVTLVSDDQEMISAHKLVLSASSPYFKHILTRTKNSHPLLCLEGISSVEVKYILDYIYQGEVLLNQEELDRFVTVASRLKIEGLIVTEEEVKEPQLPPEIQPSVVKKPPASSSSIKQKRVKTEPSKSQSFPNFTIEKNVLLPTESMQNFQNILAFSEVDQKINENFYMNPNSSFTCSICGLTKKRLSDIQTHVEHHLHQQVFLPCQSCGNTFKTRSLLSKHLCPVAVAKFT